MMKKWGKIAIPPAVLKMFERQPLQAFSINTQAQVDALTRLGLEIDELLTRFSKQRIEGRDFRRAYDLFWFWVLGAYDVLRTMDQHGNCFDAALAAQIKSLNRRLAVVRVPFAKQEIRRSGKTAERELSVVGFGRDGNTLLYEIEGMTHDASKLITELAAFFASIRLGDFKAGMKPISPGT